MRIDIDRLAEALAMTKEERILMFARGCFVAQFEMLMDDPHGFFTDGTNPAGYFALNRLIASDLGLDFDQMVAEHDNEYEQSRLLKLIHATVA